MTTWGFIGSGNIGSTVARLVLAAGHEVVMSNSRGPATLSDLVAWLGDHARAATADDAATADIVVVTIPLKHYRQVPDLSGKTVIDTMNYYPGRDGHIAELAQGMPSSQFFQASVPQARVVKAFNNIFFQHWAHWPGQRVWSAAPCPSPATTTGPWQWWSACSTRSGTTL